MIAGVILTAFLACSSASDVFRPACATDFTDDFSIIWAPDHVRYYDDNSQISLSLDSSSGSGFASKEQYMYGQISMQMRLVRGDAAGTVTAYYLRSAQTMNHDEIDFEFLGNISGQPYILQTNIFNSGTGGREQRIYLWFDPAVGFHTYSILWNEQRVILLVDGVTIRIFPNLESQGIPYLNKQALGVFSSIWNGDSWATRGGLDKIDWSHAPFIVFYQNFTADACAWTTNGDRLQCPQRQWWKASSYQTLSHSQAQDLQMVRQKYMVYNYCTDTQRYRTPPPECFFTN